MKSEPQKHSYSEETIDFEKLQKAYKIAAKLVAKYGDGHLPVFERLHAEIQKFKKNESIKNIAISIASGNINFDGKD